MSQRPTASHPVSRPPDDGLNVTSPSGNVREQGGPQAGPSHGEKASQERQSHQLSHQMVAQSPVQTYPPMSSRDGRTSSGASRGLGVHTMLNPTEPEASNTNPRLVSNVQAASVDRSPSQQTTTEISRPASRSKRPPTSPAQSSGDLGSTGKARKMLIPKPPRSISLGNAAMSARKISEPLPPGHERGWQYSAVPGSDASSEVPPMPPLPAHVQNPYNFPPPISGPPLNRRASVAVMGGPTRLPHSQSASPSPSYSSYSSQQSPAPIYQMGQPLPGASYFPGSTLRGALAEGGSSQAGPPGTEGPYMTPLSESILLQGSPSGGHGPNIRMFPIPTEHGEYYMPVEVGAASKSADEKRKRNAGASARFRERRKLKEKESSSNLQRMEQQLKEEVRKRQEAESQRDISRIQKDFYQAERNRFRDIVFNNPATRDLAMQAPQSPVFSAPPPLPHGPPPGPPTGPSFQSLESDPSQAERPSRRRRIDNPGEYGYSPASAYSPAPPHTGYQPRPEGGQHSQNLPPLHTAGAPSPGMGSMGAPPPVAQRAPFDSYPRAGYDRAWPAGPPPPPPPSDSSGQRR